MIEQEKFNDEELSAFTEMFADVLEKVCIFADKYNFDRDNILKYLSERISITSKIATISNYELKG